MIPIEVIATGDAIFFLATAPHEYGEGAQQTVLFVINVVIFMRSIVLAIIFFVMTVRLSRAISHFYVWLIQDYMWRIQATGVALSVSLAICLVLDYLTMH